MVTTQIINLLERPEAYEGREVSCTGQLVYGLASELRLVDPFMPEDERHQGLGACLWIEDAENVIESVMRSALGCIVGGPVLLDMPAVLRGTVKRAKSGLWLAGVRAGTVYSRHDMALFDFVVPHVP